MWSAEGRADRPFLQAYRRSAQRYTVIRSAVGDPDPFRVKYRQAIAEQVAEITAVCNEVSHRHLVV